ncbi:hypothetical protein Mapa_013392 [Marchantia paleacea]|nr:hypothetical protein Mapa_013392 [Marchantia paleacea]
MTAGEDATEEFDDAGHSTDAWKLMEKYLVGQVDVTSVSTTKSSQFLYKALPTVASVLVVGLVAGVILWRRKRTV